MLDYKRFIIFKNTLKYLVITISIVIFCNFLYSKYHSGYSFFFNKDKLSLGVSDANYQVINNGNLLQISAQQSFYKNKHEIIFQHILGDIEDNNYKKIFFCI